MKKISQLEIVERFKLINGDKYDYSRVKYVNMKTKVDIICAQGHIFSQTPDNHLKGKGCSFCKGITVKDLSSFIEKSNTIHKNKYDYSDSEYINSKTKIKIKCNKHDYFYQAPNVHLSGSGCKECYFDLLRNEKKYFIEKSLKIHNGFYNYSKVKYKNNRTKVTIICPLHGDFKQMPSSHLSGSGCKKCMKEKFTNSFEEFKEKSFKIFGSEYEYDEKSYLNTRVNTRIKCKKHGWFKILPDNHISKKRGCPKCSNNVSKLEVIWLDSLSIPEPWRQVTLNVNNKIYKLDALDKKNKIIYEFYGDFWHGNPKIYEENEINKRDNLSFGYLYSKTKKREEELISAGYKLVTMWESEFNI